VQDCDSIGLLWCLFYSAGEGREELHGDEVTMLLRFMLSLKNHSLSWDLAVDHCQSWEGISCDGNGNVRKVLLRQGELHGPLPDEWSGFQYLESIQISHNRLTATLPASWSAISSLKVLYVPTVSDSTAFHSGL
jgi:hypothetical protein